MPVEDDGAVPIDAELSGSRLRLVFPDSCWDIRIPEGWEPVPNQDDDQWGWELTGVAAARVRLRRRPYVQCEVDVVNLAPDTATMDLPTVAVVSGGTLVPWFGGAAGELVVALPGSTVEWTQRRGACDGDVDAFSLFPEPLVLRGGQAASSAWRRQELPAATIPPAPPFVPRQRYLPEGESLEVEHSDAALLGEGLHIVTTHEGSDVVGDPGLHTLSFLDARGTARVEVGWFTPLETLVASGLEQPGLPPGPAAWLLSAGPAGVGDVDALDVVLAQALETPDVWGVLAGMRAVAVTDLPVAGDVRAGAHHLWAGELDEAARRLLITHALIGGWEPEMVGQWLRSAATIGTTDVQQVLAGIGLGRITSAPLSHGGRDVVLARLWVAAHDESAAAAEWEMAVDTARARLMCHLSEKCNALDVAWLLAGEVLN